MDKTVLKQIDELNRMSMDELRQRWTELMGRNPDRLARDYLIRRLAYRVQELAYGGLRREVRDELNAIADGSPARPASNARKRRKPKLQPGTRLIRIWHDETYEVVVQDKGFLYNGKVYRSLSGVAKVITGAHWNGNRFFDLVPSKPRKRE